MVETASGGLLRTRVCAESLPVSSGGLYVRRLDLFVAGDAFVMGRWQSRIMACRFSNSLSVSDLFPWGDIFVFLLLVNVTLYPAVIFTLSSMKRLLYLKCMDLR